MRRLAFLPAALALLAGSQALIAAPPEPLDPKGVAAVQQALLNLGANDARESLRGFTKCFVFEAGGQDRKRMIAFLQLSPTSPSANKVARLVTDPFYGPCGPSGHAESFGSNEWAHSLSFSAQLLRGELFRAMYHRHKISGRGLIGAADIGTGWMFSDGDSFTPLQRFADCVVEKDQTDADIAVGARAGSIEEAQAYRALRPALDACVTPTESLRLSRTVLEGILSEALYKRAISPTPNLIASVN